MTGTAFAIAGAVVFGAGFLVLFYGLALEFRRPRRHGVSLVVTRRTAGEPGSEVVSSVDASSASDGVTRVAFSHDGQRYEVAATVRRLP